MSEAANRQVRDTRVQNERARAALSTIQPIYGISFINIYSREQRAHISTYLWHTHAQICSQMRGVDRPMSARGLVYITLGIRPRYTCAPFATSPLSARWLNHAVFRGNSERLACGGQNHTLHDARQAGRSLHENRRCHATRRRHAFACVYRISLIAATCVFVCGVFVRWGEGALWARSSFFALHGSTT